MVGFEGEHDRCLIFWQCSMSILLGYDTYKMFGRVAIRRGRYTACGRYINLSWRKHTCRYHAIFIYQLCTYCSIIPLSSITSSDARPSTSSLPEAITEYPSAISTHSITLKSKGYSVTDEESDAHFMTCFGYFISSFFNMVLIVYLAFVVAISTFEINV